MGANSVTERRKKKPRVLVNCVRAERIQSFCSELTELCNKYKLDIQASREAEDCISIIERDWRYPVGYEWSASL